MDKVPAALQPLAAALVALDADRLACSPAEDSLPGQVIAQARALVARTTALAAPALCPNRDRCDCIGGCKHGFDGQGAEPERLDGGDHPVAAAFVMKGALAWTEEGPGMNLPDWTRLYARQPPAHLEGSHVGAPDGTWREKLAWATQRRLTRDYRTVTLGEHDCREIIQALAAGQEAGRD